jgi:hypothetical protein
MWPKAAGRRYSAGFAIWNRFPEGEAHAWRVETSLGVQPAVGVRRAKHTPAPKRAELVVLHEAGLGFRDRQERWPRAIAKRSATSCSVSFTGLTSPLIISIPRPVTVSYCFLWFSRKVR